jgi:hypothetical protein
MNQLHLDLLRENLDTLKKSAEWVRWSYERTERLEKKDNYSEDEFAQFEVLTSRYARTDVIKYTPLLLEIIKNVSKYCEKYAGN